MNSENKLRNFIYRLLKEQVSIGPEGSIEGFEAPQYSEYEIITYDVWGNSEDGWDVNQAFHTRKFVSIPDGHEADADLIINILKSEDVVDEEMNSKNTNVDISHEHTIYFERSDDSKPLFELRKEHN